MNQERKLEKLEANLRHIQTLAYLMHGQDTDDQLPGAMLRGCGRILLRESERALEHIDALSAGQNVKA